MHSDGQSNGRQSVQITGTPVFWAYQTTESRSGVSSKENRTGLSGNRNATRSTKMPFQFITAIPLNVWKGSGCFVGIKTLATGIEALGGKVNLVTPKLHVPVYAAERVLFNYMLRYRRFQGAVTPLSDLTQMDTRLRSAVQGGMLQPLKVSSRMYCVMKPGVDAGQHGLPGASRKTARPEGRSRGYAKPLLRRAARRTLPGSRCRGRSRVDRFGQVARVLVA